MKPALSALSRLFPPPPATGGRPTRAAPWPWLARASAAAATIALFPAPLWATGEFPAGDLLISEFMASNDTALADVDGSFEDWIEVWNPTAEPVELAGWFLSDNPAEPTLWAFPPMRLEAGGYQVVFASGKNRREPGGELHTNFRLDARAGEHLCLFKPSAEGGGDEPAMVMAYADLPGQRTDVSYGLHGPREDLAAGFFETPTPGESNGSAVAGFVADTRFSVDRGYFDQPFTVQITTATEGATIIYTTDGQVPAPGTLLTPPTGSVYPGGDGIEITTTTVLRAIATKPGFRPTNVDTQTYLFLADVLRQDGSGLGGVRWGHAGSDWEMDPQVVNHADPAVRPTPDDLMALPSLSLGFNFDEFFGAQGIYIAGQNVEKATSVEYLPVDGAEGFQIDGSVQIVGGSSPNRWKSDKLSMRLRFTSDYGPPKLEYPLFGDTGGAATRFDTLVIDARLNNVWHYGGGSDANGQRGRAQYLRDQYAADLQRELGGYAPRGQHVHVYLNGIYWGIHTLHERPDDNFAAVYLGGASEDYDVMKHRTSTVVAGSGASYGALHAAAGRGLADDANYRAVEAQLDVPDFINYMLVNFYIGNTDWAHQNWYASFNKVDPAGRWRYHSWDAEKGMQGLNDNATGKNDSGGPTSLHQRLAANPEYRLLFADHLQRHCFNDGALTPGRAAALYRVRADEIDPALRAESARWGDNQRNNPYTRPDWLNTRDWLLGTYFPRRTDILLDQLASRGLWPPVDPPDFNQRGGHVATDFQLRLTAGSFLDPADVFYTTDGSDPRLRGGAVSASALEAPAGGISLTETVTIRTRARRGNEWSAIDEATFFVDTDPATDANLVISKLDYRPARPTPEEEAAGFDDRSDFEYIELMNVGDRTIDLSAVTFSDGVEFAFAGAGTNQLAAGARLLVVSNREAFEFRYGTGLPVAGEFVGRLSNDGERLALAGGGGAEILAFTYNDRPPWPEGADGGGLALVLLAPADRPALDEASSWRASRAAGGAPGGDDRLAFSTWAAGHFTPDELDRGDLSGAGADPDGDGMPNLLEYALGGNPRAADAALVLPAAGLVELEVEGRLRRFPQITYRRNRGADDARVKFEASADLVTWGDAAARSTDEVGTSDRGDGTEEVTARSAEPLPEVGDGGGSGQFFFRLRVLEGAR